MLFARAIIIAVVFYFLYSSGFGIAYGLVKTFGNSWIFVASLTSFANQNQTLPVSVSDISPDINSRQGQKNNQLVNTIDPTDSSDINNNQQLSVFDGKQEKIDDLLEKIDSLKRQLADVMLKEKLNKKQDIQEQDQPKPDQPIQSAENAVVVARYGNKGGGTSKSYAKVLISEAQIGSVSDEKQEFVELYNPNTSDVDLTGWYVQRKTKTGSSYSTFAPNALFSGKKIPANGYFLIARQGYFANLADIFVDNPLTEDNSLALKNPNEDVVDKVGWGQAEDYESRPVQNPEPDKSIGRKTDEPDTDENSADFEAGNPTPKAKNTAFINLQTQITETSAPKKILINEIQIDGQTTKDEFIELYNPNAVDIDLSGFSLKKKTSGGNESNLVSSAAFSGTIKALGFFLIVPQINDDGTKNYTGSADPDLYYSGKSFSIAPSNTILFYDSNNAILDKVGYGAAKDFETTATVNPPKGKSIERKKLGLDTDNNESDFKISDEPSSKGTFPKATIQDATDYTNNPSNNSADVAVYKLLITWQSKSPNIDFYQVQYKLNGADFKDWLPSATKTQEYLQGAYSLLNDDVYQFRVRAQDKDGNVGDWSPEIKVDLANPIVINEVAYAGTDASPDDQWIELYNRTDKDIDLANWKIVSGSDGKDTLNLSLKGIILSKSYFILERLDDSTLSDVSADQIFADPIGKSYLYLRNQNNRYVDEFYMPSSGLDVNNFVKNGSHYSIERVSASAFGMSDKNWKISNGKTLNGKDRSGNQIYGTPGQQNSVNQLYTYYSSSFMKDATLKKELSPYLFSGDVQVFKNVVLTLEPGVVVKFYDNQSRLTVNGTLKALGADADKIIFTSFLDDEYGGDSNGDGSDSLPASGDWPGLHFLPDSQSSQLENTVFRYAEKAVFAEGASPKVNNSYFENNNFGMYVNSFYDFANNINILAKPEISNNNFVKNSYPIYFGLPSLPFFTNNQASDNQFNAIALGGDITSNLALTPDLPYLARGVITVPENTTLTLSPGAVMDFLDNSSGLQVKGTLSAVGSPQSQIIFKPYNTTSLPGDWLGLSFAKTSQNSQLENVDISYAGSLNNPDFGAGIKVDQSSISLKNSVVKKNTNNGVWLINSPSAIDNAQFLEQNTSTISSDAKAVYIQGGLPAIYNSYFKDNYYGVYADSWHDPDTGADIPANPDMQNNQFENSIKADIFP